jgi:hypothetical protein
MQTLGGAMDPGRWRPVPAGAASVLLTRTPSSTRGWPVALSSLPLRGSKKGASLKASKNEFKKPWSPPS